jgi:hypothetical protein
MEMNWKGIKVKMYCDVLPKAGILKSGYTAIASQRLRETRSRRNGEVGY